MPLSAFGQTVSGSSNAPFYIYSTSTQVSNQYLFIPVNSTGATAYPEWHFVFESSGQYYLKLNGTILNQGYASKGYSTSYLWSSNLTVSPISPELELNGVTYNFTDVHFTGQLTANIIQSVSISSTYPGQTQTLTVQAGKSGVLMYPHWNITMVSSVKEPWVILVNGKIAQNGTVSGTTYADIDMGNASEVSVIVSIGSSQYKFLNEPIASVPLQKYYAPPSPPLVSTAIEDLIAGVRYVIGGFVSYLGVTVLVRKLVTTRKKRKATEI